MDVMIVRTKRKKPLIRVSEDLSVTLRVPLGYSERKIKQVLKANESWINEAVETMREKVAEYEAEGCEKLTEEEIKELKVKAKDVIPPLVEHYAEIMGVDYGRITIKSQKTRWGSCSSKGNLNFNCILMLAPQEVIEYIVVHELCHRKEMNHSTAFWAEVEKVLPDYKNQVRWLKDKGRIIMWRLN